MTDMPTDAPTRITLNLLPKAAEQLWQLGEELQINKTDVVNKAIQLYAFLETEQREEGARLMLGYPDGKIREILVL